MKVLILNGSPRINGNTSIALKEVEKTLNENGIETIYIDVGTKNIVGCKACGYCKQNNKCVNDDGVNEILEIFKEADGLVVGSPVYYASANATLVALLQKMFYASNFSKHMKVGASVACARRSGTTATFDELNKFFTIAGMPVISSTYWNNIYGSNQGDALKDEEGLQTMRNLANNMAFMIKAIKDAKEKYGLPIQEREVTTDFIK